MRLLNLIIDFYLFFALILVVCVVYSFTTFRPNLTSGLLQAILPWPRIGMLSLVTVSPVITAFHNYILDHTSGPVAQRIEALRLYGSRWALSEDSGFKSFQSRPEVYLVKTWCDRQQLWKAVITGDTVTRLSIPIRGRGKITWRRSEVKFDRNVVKEETTTKKKKTTKMRTKSPQ